MKKYDSYKDSGIEWIGEIPSHWNMGKIKYSDTVIMGQSPLSDDCNSEGFGLPFLQGNAEFGKTHPTPKLFCETPNKIADVNDVLLSVRAPVGALNIADQKFGIGRGLCAIRPEKSNFKYIYYWLLHSNKELDSVSTGSTFKAISLDDVKNINFPSIDIEEQTTIANYLDQKTNQIHDLIAKKERLIQLLEEERTAIINQAVTKGLDPTVPMKDSGIEWLGEIPEHWEVKRMRYLCDITTGGKDTENREDDGQYPFYVRSQTVERISTYSFDGEAILTAGDGVGVCKVWHYVNEKFDFHQRVYMMCNFKSLIGKYLFYYLKENFGKEVMKLSAKSTVDSLRRPMFQNFLVCFGSIEEQEQIIHSIDNEVQRIQTIVTKTQQEIELLKEYKTALISEVVTGKVKVVAD